MQTHLPGTSPVVASYSCEHREHQIPSEAVEVFKFGCGFVAGCTCGPESLAEIPDLPHNLGGGHVVLIGGKNLSPGLWLALDELASRWYSHDPDGVALSRERSEREIRQDYRAELAP